MSKQEPQRPSSVPQEANWNSSEGEWELGPVNQTGQKIGEWKWWAPAGHLCCHTFFDDQGKPLRFKRFHPNGEVSREGDLTNDTDIYYRSTEETTEYFAYNTEEDDIWKAVKRPGFPVSFDYYDKEGNHLNPRIKPSTLPIVEKDRALLRQETSILLQKGQSSMKGELQKGDLERIMDLSNDERKDFFYSHLNYFPGTDDAEYIFYKGDLKLKDLSSFYSLGIVALIVDGNLTVEETIYISSEPYQLLFVTGNLKAKNILSSGKLIVNGDLEVQSCLIGRGDDGRTRVYGNFKARFFYPEYYFFWVNGNAQFECAFGNPEALKAANASGCAFNYNDKTVKDFLELLHPNILNNIDIKQNKYLQELCSDDSVWRYINEKQFWRYVFNGQPVFKDEA